MIYKEVEEKEEEEELVYINENKFNAQESLDRTFNVIYILSAEQLYLRAVEDRVKNNLYGWYGALMPREY